MNSNKRFLDLKSNDVDKFIDFLTNLKPVIGRFGGRYYKINGDDNKLLWTESRLKDFD